MPIYTLLCGCGHSEEYLLSPNDVALAVPCEACGADLCVPTNRDWQADMPQIQGDTVAGGAQWSGYFDPGLGIWINSKRQRNEEMKRQGKEEWAPDPVEKDMLSEIRYIRKNSDMKTDTTAVKAARDVGVAADKKRKRQAINAAVTRGMADLKA